MVLEHEHEYADQSAAIMAIAPKIGCGRDTLRRWVKQPDIDSGRKDGQTSADRAQIKAMEREIRELRQANEILRKASAYFAPALTHAPHVLPGNGQGIAQQCTRGEWISANHAQKTR